MQARTWSRFAVALLVGCTGAGSDKTPPEATPVPDVEDTGDTAFEEVSIPGEDAILTIISPENGETVTSPFEVVWEVNGCDINTPRNDDGACHLHRFLNGERLNEPITDGFGLYSYVAFDMNVTEGGQYTLAIELIPNGKPTAATFDDEPHLVPIRDQIEIVVLAPPVDTDVVDTDPPDTDPPDTDVPDTDVDTDVVDTDPDSDSDAADTDADTDDTDPSDTGPDTVDDDNDSFSEADGDCDDGNPVINPAATDLVGDGFDQNCDGVDGTDLDGDGFASELSGGDDCDDALASVYPGAPEVPGDGVDQDCQGGDAPDTDQDTDAP